MFRSSFFLGAALAVSLGSASAFAEARPAARVMCISGPCLLMQTAQLAPPIAAPFAAQPLPGGVPGQQGFAPQGGFAQPGFPAQQPGFAQPGVGRPGVSGPVPPIRAGVGGFPQGQGFHSGPPGFGPQPVIGQPCGNRCARVNVRVVRSRGGCGGCGQQRFAMCYRSMSQCGGGNGCGRRCGGGGFGGGRGGVSVRVGVNVNIGGRGRMF